jgi:hypothetical protein
MNISGVTNGERNAFVRGHYGTREGKKQRNNANRKVAAAVNITKAVKRHPVLTLAVSVLLAKRGQYTETTPVAMTIIFPLLRPLRTAPSLRDERSHRLC